MFGEALTLVGRRVRLDPLRISDAAGLAGASADGELWRLPFTSVPHPDTMDEFVAGRLAEAAEGTWAPFTVTAAGRIVGLTNYLNVDAANRRLEIGGTWYAASVQRTAVNTETKLLLLGHAFDGLNCLAVEFRVHHANVGSQTAVERLGAHRDGVLRQHRIMPDGQLRDTVVYSIIDQEWPTVRERLTELLSR